MRFILLPFLLISSLYANRIELVTNGVSDWKKHAKILSKKGSDLELVESDLKGFQGLLKHKGWWGTILRKISLEYPRKIKVDPAISKIIFMNVPTSCNRKYNLHKLPKEKLILFMWEPPIRSRKMYSSKIQNCFSKIYTWNDDLVDNQIYFKFYYPVLQPMIENVPDFEEKKLCTLVCGATTDKSRHHPNELYSHRIKAIRFFENCKEEGFAFYGRNWDAHKYPSYQGPISDKIAVIKEYRFTLCYENCRDIPGYITEKIFDCFAAGTIPIYWGANNIEDYIPKQCFIDRRDFANLEQLYAFIKGMKKDEYEIYLQNIKIYLKSEKAALFSEKHFEEIFFDAATG